MSKKAIVLGAGMVGSAIAMDLKRHGLAVTVADRQQKALDRAAGKYGVATREADLGDPAVVRAIVADHDIVVGALPSFLGLQTMRAVIEAGKPCCDISFLEEDAGVLSPLAEERGVSVVHDAGVGPGMSNMLIGWAVSTLARCDRIEVHVGGLPAVRRWPFEYKVGFSPIDLIEEYLRPARFVEHGKMVVREALSEPELMDFPGVGTLESFNTDGLRSLLRTMPEVPFMREKTLRYPGHVELMRVFRETGLFGKEPIDVGGQEVRPLDLTSALLFPRWAFAEGEADITVMRVSVEGEKDGRKTRYLWNLLDRYDPETDLRSMSRTTGFTASVLTLLMAEGRFTRPGVHPPEIPGREPGMVETMLSELRDRGVVYQARVEQG